MFKATLTITDRNERAVTNYCVQHLRTKGYSINKPNSKNELNWQFCKRVGIHSETLRRATKRKGCPDVVLLTGPSGKIISLQSNKDFEEFVLRNKGDL